MRIRAVSIVVPLVAGVLLAGCARHATRVAVVPDAPPPAPAQVVTPAATPINAGLSPAATLWHLRAGLNVAALACRWPDEATIAARYNALLQQRADALKAAEAAYAAEYRAGGGDWRDRYDDEQTRLYNFFGQSTGRAAFCAAAAAALTELEAVPDTALAGEAPARLASLDHAFAPPWLAVDPRVFGTSPVQVAAR